MRRRHFITLLGTAAAATWPLRACAQNRAMPVVGTLGVMSAGEYVPFVDAFLEGLKEEGYFPGRNVAIEYRWADHRYERLPQLAADLVRRHVVVLVPFGGANPTLALHAATTTIPIVAAIAANPVKLGLISNLSHPGGNVTGVDMLTTDITAKRLEILSELIPNAQPIGMLVNPNNPDAENQLGDAKKAALALGRKLYAAKGGSDREIDAAFTALAQQKIRALLVGNDAFLNTRREQIVGLAARYRIPALYPYRLFVAAGGLISYSPSLSDCYRLSGIYAGRILKGANAADLPMLTPTKFEFVINLKAAKALGLTVPPALLARADEVIE
jgi:putative tryptophan/tyrosine transport system substrate-binding protein